MLFWWTLCYAAAHKQLFKNSVEWQGCKISCCQRIWIWIKWFCPLVSLILWFIVIYHFTFFKYWKYVNICLETRVVHVKKIYVRQLKKFELYFITVFKIIFWYHFNLRYCLCNFYWKKYWLRKMDKKKWILIIEYN